MKPNFPIIFFLILVVILFFGLFTNTKVIQSPLIGKHLPNFTLTTLRSSQVVSKDDLTKEPMLLNVWASWCLACIKEHSILKSIQGNNHIKIIGINYKDERSDAIGWLNIYGDPYKYNLYDVNGEFAIDLGVYGVPETFLVDQNGLIRAKHVGELTEEIYTKKLLPMIKKINEKN